jgi:hypothetical protein
MPIGVERVENVDEYNLQKAERDMAGNGLIRVPI